MQVQEEEESAGVGGDAEDTVFGEAMADKFNVNIRDDLSEVCMECDTHRSHCQNTRRVHASGQH